MTAATEIASGITFGEITRYVRAAVADALPAYGEQTWRSEPADALAERVTERIMAGIASPIFDAAVRTGTEAGRRVAVAKAESYASDAAKFSDAGRLGMPILSEAEDAHWAKVYGIVAQELRKIGGAS